MTTKQNPARYLPHLPGLVFGEVIYWMTLLGSVLAMVGLVLTYATGASGTDPTAMLSGVWSGQSVAEIWRSASNSQPQGHWYFEQLGTGQGLTAAGIALGVFSVVPDGCCGDGTAG